MDKKELELQAEYFKSKIENEENTIANKFVSIFRNYVSSKDVDFSHYDYSEDLGFRCDIIGNPNIYIHLNWRDENFYTHAGDYISNDNYNNIFVIADIWKHKEEIEKKIKTIDYSFLNALVARFEEVEKELTKIETQEEDELKNRLFVVGNIFAIDSSVKAKRDENRLLECIFPGCCIYTDISNVKIEVTSNKTNSKKFGYKATWAENGVEKTKEGQIKKKYIVNFIQERNYLMSLDNPNIYKDVNDISWFIK